MTDGAVVDVSGDEPARIITVDRPDVLAVETGMPDPLGRLREGDAYVERWIHHVGFSFRGPRWGDTGHRASGAARGTGTPPRVLGDAAVKTLPGRNANLRMKSWASRASTATQEATQPGWRRSPVAMVHRVDPSCRWSGRGSSPRRGSAMPGMGPGRRRCRRFLGPAAGCWEWRCTRAPPRRSVVLAMWFRCRWRQGPGTHRAWLPTRRTRRPKLDLPVLNLHCRQRTAVGITLNCHVSWCGRVARRGW